MNERKKMKRKTKTNSNRTEFSIFCFCLNLEIYFVKWKKMFLCSVEDSLRVHDVVFSLAQSKKIVSKAKCVRRKIDIRTSLNRWCCRYHPPFPSIGHACAMHHRRKLTSISWPKPIVVHVRVHTDARVCAGVCVRCARNVRRTHR